MQRQIHGQDKELVVSCGDSRFVVESKEQADFLVAYLRAAFGATTYEICRNRNEAPVGNVLWLKAMQQYGALWREIAAEDWAAGLGTLLDLSGHSRLDRTRELMNLSRKYVHYRDWGVVGSDLVRALKRQIDDSKRGGDDRSRGASAKKTVASEVD